MAQQVAAKWAAAFGFAIGCRSESLFDSFVGLLLWHRDLSNLLASNNRFTQRPTSSWLLRGREYKHGRQTVPVRQLEKLGQHRTSGKGPGIESKQ